MKKIIVFALITSVFCIAAMAAPPKPGLTASKAATTINLSKKPILVLSQAALEAIKASFAKRNFHAVPQGVSDPLAVTPAVVNFVVSTKDEGGNWQLFAVGEGPFYSTAPGIGGNINVNLPKNTAVKVFADCTLVLQGSSGTYSKHVQGVKEYPGFSSDGTETMYMSEPIY